MGLHEARITAMQILYTSDLNGTSVDQVLMTYENNDPKAVEFVLGVTNQLEKIDFIISVCLKNYTIDRLNLVDKAIIRLAVSEMLSGTDKKIVINEAIELTKEFSDQGDHKAASFNNRLLDNISARLKELA